MQPVVLVQSVNCVKTKRKTGITIAHIMATFRYLMEIFHIIARTMMGLEDPVEIRNRIMRCNREVHIISSLEVGGQLRIATCGKQYESLEEDDRKDRRKCRCH